MDRDGVIIVDHGYVGSIERVELIPGSPEAIAAFNRSAIPVAVLTNQSGVARGLFTTDDVETVHQYISEQLATFEAHIDLFVFCPYHPDGIVRAFARRSADRKPESGMAEAAAAILDLDLGRSWVVGDRTEDIELAKTIGAYPLLLGPPGTAYPGASCFPDLAQAARFILRHIQL